MTSQRTTADRLHSVAIHLLRWARVDDVQTGLSAPRLSILSVLVYGGTRTVGELAAAEQVSTPTMTKLLQALEADGYVTRRRDAVDARVQQMSVTARGRRALEEGRRMRLERIETMLSGLSVREAEQIERAVSVLEKGLTRVREL
jgi:DNA-binding MarR family transcriptional regulator